MFWWGVTIPGLVAVGSGLVLDKLIPGFGAVRSEMQIAQMIHAVAAFWMMALILGHIYMGTIGVRGALKAMKTGYVSDEWAKEHHDLWYEDIKAGKIPAQRSQPTASSPSTPLVHGQKV
jgi:formate dehydrogenase subunit gamma